MWDRIRSTVHSTDDGRVVIENARRDLEHALRISAEGYLVRELGPIPATRSSQPEERVIDLTRGRSVEGVVIDRKLEN